MDARRKAFLAVPAAVAALVVLFGVLGYFIGKAVGLPIRLGLPVPVRGLGVILLLLGFGFMAWVSRYRKPSDIVASTFLTMRKALREGRADEREARTEPLVVEGPQRHVRHPLYFAVVILFLGWWLLLEYTFLLFLAGLLLLWFNLVVIPLEERELRGLFGGEYEAYAKAVPRFVPSLTRRWK